MKNKYTAADKLTIAGGSNGGRLWMYLITRDTLALRFSAGLLVAACVNRAPPGTFGAAVAEVGVLDLLKVLNNSSIYPLHLPLRSFIADEQHHPLVRSVHDRACVDF